MGAHKDLEVWQKNIDSVKDIYICTRSYSKEELFGLVFQIRRSVVSIPSNIVEGFSRGLKKECEHFVYTALGSASELETRLIISKELDFLENVLYCKLSSLFNEVIKMLSSLINLIKIKG